MVYLTGDTHGDFGRFRSPASRRIKKGDILIILGDFGFFWDDGKSEKLLLKKLSKRPYTILFMDGPHENYSLLDALPEETLYGGTVRRAADNIFYLQRGEIYEIENETYFTFGGGADPELTHESSINRERGLPSREQTDNAKSNLARYGNTVDYILTHEPSQKIGGYLNSTPSPSGTSIFLTSIEDAAQYKRWYFGSMHIDKQISKNHRALFRDIIPVHEPDKRGPKHASKK